jgi:hypothetical protein
MKSTEPRNAPKARVIEPIRLRAADRPSDACAAAIRLFAREVAGVKDEEALAGIQVSHYLGANVSVTLAGLPDDKAKTMRSLLTAYSYGSAIEDHNGAKNVEFREVGRPKGRSEIKDPYEYLIDTIKNIAKEHKLEKQLSAALSKVPNAQGQKR